MNCNDKKYIFRDYLTAEQLETKKRTGDINNIVKQDGTEAERVTVQKSTIFVGEKEYKKQVHAPDPTSVLQLSMTRLNMIMATKLDRGDDMNIEGNKFVAYNLCTNSYDMINQAYMKVRLDHAEARHIVCVWSVPDPTEYEGNDYCEDEEYGVGKHILEVLTKNGINNRAIFIVRNTGQKLHGNRIRTYVNMVENVIKKFAVNTVNGKTQKIEEEVEPIAEPNTKNSPTYADITKDSRPTKYYKTRGGRGAPRGGRGGPQRGGKGAPIAPKTRYVPPTFPVPRRKDEQEKNGM